ncbi:MAG TPA: o-succinylbenzoate synthase [Flavobacteriaceae bacterium]|nr:o-succinylbenzoate synthase [Flavobacteriaceae bacterium]
MKASFSRYILNFKNPSGTSRGILKTKETFFLKIENGKKSGIGECALFRGLSIDDRPDYEEKLNWVCENISLGKEKLLQELIEFPSIQFGIETAFQSLLSKSEFELFPSEFTEGKASIPINGLIWMGEKAFMKKQINEKIKHGFRCIKLKIGAIDFVSELELLKYIRKEFSENDIEIRVDANGAFQPKETLEKLKRLSDFNLHSIEQPIKQGQIQEMAELCAKTPLSIALDEELIGCFGVTNKEKLLQTIRPQFIILKPSLVGGFAGSDQWIDLAENKQIGWWITSALESNIGLNAIAQWTFLKNPIMPQGLGTGGLFTNNFKSPLEMEGGNLIFGHLKNQQILPHIS